MRTPYYREQVLEGIAREVITAYDPNLYYGVPRMIPIENIIEAQGDHAGISVPAENRVCLGRNDF